MCRASPKLIVTKTRIKKLKMFFTLYSKISCSACKQAKLLPVCQRRIVKVKKNCLINYILYPSSCQV